MGARRRLGRASWRRTTPRPARRDRPLVAALPAVRRAAAAGPVLVVDVTTVDRLGCSAPSEVHWLRRPRPQALIIAIDGQWCPCRLTSRPRCPRSTGPAARPATIRSPARRGSAGRTARPGVRRGSSNVLSSARTSCRPASISRSGSSSPYSGSAPAARNAPATAAIAPDSSPGRRRRGRTSAWPARGGCHRTRRPRGSSTPPGRSLPTSGAPCAPVADVLEQGARVDQVELAVRHLLARRRADAPARGRSPARPRTGCPGR